MEVPDFSSHRSQNLFDPSLLGEALKRRFPIMEDDSFSGLLARLDAADMDKDDLGHQRADPEEA